MKIIKLVIADSAISLAPQSWKKNKKIRQYVNKYNRYPIVDASIHQHLLKSIPLEKRKDRPDILHFGLLTILGYSRLIPELEVSFATDDMYFEVDPTTNLPRSQNRFYGILEQLLSGNYSGTYFNQTRFPDFSTENTIVFSSEGEPIQPKDFEATNFVFGGFAHGSFKSSMYNSIKTVKLVEQPLELWTALSMFINQYLEFHGY